MTQNYFEPRAVQADLQAFENHLKSLRPAVAASSEADVIYRCGWEAALAAQVKPLSFTSIRNAVNGTCFAVGIATGTAACFGLWLCLSLVIDTSGRGRQALEIASSEATVKMNPNADEPKSDESNASLVREVQTSSAIGAASDMLSLDQRSWHTGEYSGQDFRSSPADSIAALVSPVANRQWKLSVEPSQATVDSLSEKDNQNTRPAIPRLGDLHRQGDTWRDISADLY